MSLRIRRQRIYYWNGMFSLAPKKNLSNWSGFLQSAIIFWVNKKRKRRGRSLRRENRTGETRALPEMLSSPLMFLCWNLIHSSGFTHNLSLRWPKCFPYAWSGGFLAKSGFPISLHLLEALFLWTIWFSEPLPPLLWNGSDDWKLTRLLMESSPSVHEKMFHKPWSAIKHLLSGLFYFFFFLEDFL